MSDHTNFLNIVEGSAAVRDRWAALVERTVSEAGAHGVTLEADDILDLRSARTAALGAPLDEDEYQAELLALPALSDTARKAAIASGDEDARAAAISDVNKITDDVHAERWMSSAARRLSKARSLGIATPIAEQDTTSANQRLKMLKDVRDPATRISLARKWGLL